MDLFIRSQEFEKVSGEVHLPEDPNDWPKEILDEVFKQVPYIADFRPHVVMTKVDAERGYGIGHVEISNESEAQLGTPPAQLEAAGIRNVRIPIVINNGKMSPFDLLVNDAGQVVPLTESRLRQAIFRPQMFDITSKTPGDQSMIGQLYPPYRQNYGFGGGGVAVPAQGMGKSGSALSAEEELIRILEEDDKGFRKVKEAAELTEAARDKIKAKNFAVPAKSSDTGEGKYPIHDRSHAANALARVDQHGSPSEKAKVHAAVAKKFPELAARSSVPAVQRKAKEKTSAILPDIAHTINQSDLENFWGTINEDYGLQAALRKNAEATKGALELLAKIEPVSLEKKAAALPHFVKPTVVQISLNSDGYLVKSASHRYWRVYTAHLDRGELVEQFGEKVAMAVDTSGCVTLAEDAKEDSVEKRAEVEPVTHPGIYKVFSEDGKEIIGFVIPNLLDVDGQAMPLALFTNGSQTTVQAEIFGEPAGEGMSLPTGPVGGHGAFFEVGEDGVLKATIPLELAGSAEADGVSTWHGQTFDGRPVQVSVQPNIVEPVGTPEGKLLIPQHWKWTPMDKAQEVALAGGDEHPDAGAAKSEMGMADTEPPPATTKDGQEPPPAPDKEKKSWVELRGSNEVFSLSGPAVHKLASTDRTLIDIDDTMFLLAGLGVEQGYGASKLAEAMTGSHPVRVITSRGLELADDIEKWASARAGEIYARLPDLKRVLVKEAASMPDPDSVDIVLSLGFVNPENIMAFVGHIPEIDETQCKLCNLLLASRLGMPNLSTGALERSVRAIEEVLEGLKVIAFQG